MPWDEEKFLRVNQFMLLSVCAWFPVLLPLKKKKVLIEKPTFYNNKKMLIHIIKGFFTK